MDVMVILHLLVPPFLLAGWMCLSAASAKKSEAALAAGVYFIVLLGISVFYEKEDISISTFLHIGKATWFYLLIDSIITVVFMIMLYMAMAAAEVGKIHPAYLAALYMAGYSEIFVGGLVVSPLSIVIIVMLLSGFVVIIISEKDKKWGIFIFAIMILKMFELFIGRTFGVQSLTINEKLVSYCIEIVIVIGVIIAKGGAKILHSMSLLSGVYLILGTLCMYLSEVSYNTTVNFVSPSIPQIVVTMVKYAAPFGTILMAAGVLKEKINGNKMIGTALVVVAMELSLLK